MSFRVEPIDHAADDLVEQDARHADDFDQEPWVSPYLRRPLRSLDEVLAERRACERRAKMAKAFEARRQAKLIAFTAGRKLTSQVA